MTIIAIPDPCAVVLIGAAGVGKSTFAARHFDPSEILSSDRFRALVSGDEADQGATRAAFGRLHRELARRLARGRLTLIDATNIERTARRTLLTRAGIAGVPVVAIVLDLPTAVVLSRNSARPGRTVDEAVVLRHLEHLRLAVQDGGLRLKAEGFDQVVILGDPLEVDGVRIVRQPT